MRAVVDPSATRLDELAGSDGRGMSDHRDEIALSARLTRSTQKPLSRLWKLTRSTSPARS
jgi:hypothetical protein